jgi:hypothetical protein
LSSYESAFVHGIQAGAFVLIFDGFDEILAEKPAALENSSALRRLRAAENRRAPYVLLMWS